MKRWREYLRRAPEFWLVAFLIAPVVYVLSSGPVLAAAFWLRDQTNWDGFYSVMWLYWPLSEGPLAFPFWFYVQWWTQLFGTMPPG
jgi:hypothetical protein